MQLKFFLQSELSLNAFKHLHTYEIHTQTHAQTREHTRTHTCTYQATQASPENREEGILPDHILSGQKIN